MKNKTSFGEYFDDQRDRIVADMPTGKNTELYNAWREDYDKRQREKKEKKYKKELDECSEKGVEISEECKTYFNKKFQSDSDKKEKNNKADYIDENTQLFWWESIGT